jgi:hypothetical protein
MACGRQNQAVRTATSAMLWSLWSVTMKTGTMRFQRVSDLNVLKFCMEQNDRTQTDLARLLGSRSRASEILSGRRALTLEQIRTLAKEWRIPASALLEIEAA